MFRIFPLFSFCLFFLVPVGISADPLPVKNPAAEPHTIEMINIPGGCFLMGSAHGRETEKPVHLVCVSSFQLGKYEVTQEQWTDVMGSNPAHFSECGSKCPVENVSWNDVKHFIYQLNQKTGKQYRLPSEAEWEYAARAQTETDFPYNSDEKQLCRYANGADLSTDYPWRNSTCSDGVGKSTTVVGSYQPNAFGLYDMHGNVNEWLQDCWHEDYEGAPSNGFSRQDGHCNKRVTRGGGWTSRVSYLRPSHRANQLTSFKMHSIGFRLAHD